MTERWDAVVVGAGIAGLTAGITFATAGRRVVVLDRLGRAGGLSGTWTDGEAVFVRGSLDFMLGLYRRLEGLGVRVPWTETRSLLHIGARTVQLPPRLADAGFWLRAGPGMLGAVLRVARGASLTQALAGSSTAAVQAFGGVLLPGALLFDDICADDAAITGSHVVEDSLHRQAMVDGGPQVLIDALVGRLQALGGELRLGVTAERPRRDGEQIVVPTPSGELVADRVVSSAPRWDAWSSAHRDGLALGQILVHLHRPARLAAEALYHVPADVRAWQAALDAGLWHDDMGVSLVDPRLGPGSERQTLVGYVPLPRGLRALEEAEQARRLGELLATADRMAPGLDVRSARLILPDAYAALHGLDPTPARHLPVQGHPRPPARDPDTGVVHVGPSVEPSAAYGAAIVRTAIAAAS